MVNNRLKVYGGEGTYMTSVGDALIKHGHDVQYFGLKDPDELHSNRYGIYAKKSKNPLSIFKSKFNRKQFAKILDAFKPDIIHLNLIYYTLTPYILLEAKARGIPVVQTIHDSKMVCPSYQLFNLKENKPCSECVDGNYKRCFKDKCAKNNKLLSYLAYKEQKYNHKKDYYSLIDKIIFPSNFMRKLHLDAGLDFEKTVVLPNFSRLSSKRNCEKKNYYIYFGRINYFKGMNILKAAIEQMKNINFVVVGDGDQNGLFEGLANCKLLGFKSGDELIELVSSAKASIYPPILMENCPMSVAESIYLGTPVIGSNIGGVPELIRDGKTGLLFKSNDFNDLISKIKLMETKELYSKLLKGCKNDVKSIMNIDNYISKLVEIYKSLI